MDTLPCRVCRQGEAVSLGPIADCGEFAGHKIVPPIKGGDLWRCKRCGSMFRHPTLSSGDYLAMYAQAPSTVWMEGEGARNDFAVIYAYLEKYTGGRILDVGCYSGNFLAGLPGNFVKYGLEPSTQAAACAASNGITVLGQTLDDLGPEQVFDVVVSIDVIEHVLDVEEFLDQALAHVRENGLLIISSGNPDSFFWGKVLKSSFWYNQFAEHVTFPGYNYYLGFASRHSMPPPEQIQFRYRQMKVMARLSAALRTFMFTFFPAAYQALRRMLGKSGAASDAIAAGNPVITPGVFTDHHAIFFRKKGLQ